MSVIFLFIDGVGVGKDHGSNPFAADRWPGFSLLAGGQLLTAQAKEIRETEHHFSAVDATLGVEGLPQSGTGQTALFTGKNAAKEIGKHFGPFPHSGIKQLLREQSLFNKAQAAGKSCAFMNGYPDIFFEKSEARNRWSCTTLMTKSAAVKLRTTEDVKNKKAITAGLTQKAWGNYLSINVPIITPKEAADRIIKQLVNTDLILYEYYLTDKAGHGRAEVSTTEIISRYDQFLQALIHNKPTNTTIVLCSDHGNLEDLSVKTHTRNPVPLAALGPGAPAFHKAESIMDVTPGILEILDL